jgi:hypothetical protein
VLTRHLQVDRESQWLKLTHSTKTSFSSLSLLLPPYITLVSDSSLDILSESISGKEGKRIRGRGSISLPSGDRSSNSHNGKIDHVMQEWPMCLKNLLNWKGREVARKSIWFCRVEHLNTFKMRNRFWTCFRFNESYFLPRANIFSSLVLQPGST